MRRFDRVGDVKRHIVSVGGMLELPHREPSMDYEDVLKLVGMASRDVREVSKAYRLAVFNVLAHNQNDHVKNFTLIESAEGNGTWQFSPAYDLTFSSGMGGTEHMTSVEGEGQPSLASLQRLGQRLGVDDADSIVQQVFQAVEAWPDFAVEQKVPSGQINTIWQGISQGAAFAAL